MSGASASPHAIARVRHETRRRTLVVASVETLTPRMRRVHFASADLHDFGSDGPDDHVKLLLPLPDGQVAKRDYTPRAFDPAAGTLTIDFALHEAGPATAWALAADVGDPLEIGGPRGSMIVADDFDWVLLVGDETALPAIGRRVEGLRPGVPVTTIVIVDGPAERQTFSTRAAWTPVWVERRGSAIDDGAALVASLPARLPEGDGYVWIAAETSAARVVRKHVVDGLGHPSEWLKAAGYWVRGEGGGHETIKD